MPIRAANSSPSAGRRPLAAVPSRVITVLGAALLTFAALAAWHNSFSGPFVFDDTPAVVDNPTIRHLWPPGPLLLVGDDGGTVGGRPVVNLTLALNHVLGGTNVAGYHLLNLLIHLLAGLTLFGLVRRTLAWAPGAQACRAPGEVHGMFGRVPKDYLALAIALLWTVHPLQTEAVTYVVQRAESLMGLFYLLTLYCFRRAVDAPEPGAWPWLAWLACLLGMATKEVMASAPLMVLLYDRTFLLGGFRAALRQRPKFYTALASTWLLLALLILHTHSRGGSAGFETGVAWWAYSLTQCRAIIHYLRLVFWPHPLVFDYGDGLVTSPLAVAPQAVLLGLLLAGTAWALWRRPVLGFLGAWFFLILAPSSSVVPVVTQTMAEHRMYLPLAGVLAGLAGGAYRLLGPRSLALLAALALGLGGLTVARNRDYRSQLGLWDDTLRDCPDNARAANNVGSIWLQRNEPARAAPYFVEALRLKPGYASAHYNLGLVLARSGQPAAAALQFQAALRQDRTAADIHVNLGAAWLKLGRADDARREFETALRLQPGSTDAQVNLGLAFSALRRPEDAIAHYRAALRLQPGLATAEIYLAEELQSIGHTDEAIAHYQAALRLQPDRAQIHFTLANLLARAGRLDDAIAEFRQVLRLDPGDLQVRNNLGNALLMDGRVAEAIAEYEEILRRQPDNASVRANLRQARAMLAGAAPAP
jgi:protein O-mannosyl-transferase